MTNPLRTSLLALAILVPLRGGSFTATHSIPASQDTYVRVGGSAATNFNGNEILESRSGGVADLIIDAHVEFHQMPDALNTANFSHDAWLLPDLAALSQIDETTFPYNDFNASGAYNSQLINLTPSQPALLVLTTVPEPQTWLSCSLGPCALGFVGSTGASSILQPCAAAEHFGNPAAA